MVKSHSFKTRLFQTKFRSIKFKCLLFIAIVISIYFIIPYTYVKLSILLQTKIENNLELKNVILHLDFKGSPPKISYLKTLLPKLQSLGVTGLLMEYEDMFPYKGQLVNLSATNHYKMKELQEFVSLAVHVGFDVIPLVQTFGHMEHALKLSEFQHLREVPLNPDSICPSQLESQKLIKNMLEQVINFHQKISPLKYLHIGADEVYHINKCVQCTRRHTSEMDIYLSHVDTILGIVKATSPSTTVLIWDDMLRKIPMNKWEDIKFDKYNVEPVYWEYRPTFQISHSSMMEYHKKFKNIWIASAFKGADGIIATFPDIRRRFLNHFSWLKSIVDYKFGGESDVFDFRGIILTGWSRYSHMDPPCELLPVSIPSLYLNLLLLKKIKYIDLNFDEHDIIIFNKYLLKDLTGNLHCIETINIDYFDSTNCYFGGNELYNILKDLDRVVTDITSEMSNVQTDLSSLEFYSKTNNNNLNRLQENIEWCKSSMNDLNYIKNKLLNNLSFYYDSCFVDEYLNYKLNNPMKIMNNILKSLQNMSKIRSWKRRPYS